MLPAALALFFGINDLEATMSTVGVALDISWVSFEADYQVYAFSLSRQFSFKNELSRFIQCDKVVNIRQLHFMLFHSRDSKIKEPLSWWQLKASTPSCQPFCAP